MPDNGTLLIQVKPTSQLSDPDVGGFPVSSMPQQQPSKSYIVTTRTVKLDAIPFKLVRFV